MTITNPTQKEILELYFLFAPDKLAQARIPAVPELVLADHDVAALMGAFVVEHRYINVIIQGALAEIWKRLRLDVEERRDHALDYIVGSQM